MAPSSRRRKDASEIGKLIDEVGGKLPKELRKQLRPGIRKAGMPVLRKAKANASWSKTIPRATRLSIRLGSSKRTGVRIETNRHRAPHARPHENRGREGNFRHPVHGNRSVWVDQRARPYMWPAVRDSREQVAKDIDAAVVAAAKNAGFR